MTDKKTETKTKTRVKSKSLVVVESPTKQKTISRILGPQFIVKSSYGHVRDLPEKELGVDEKAGFAPVYVPLARAKKNISEIKEAEKTAGLLYLATDPDREGEAIAWHLVELLKPSPAKVRRISFHEITKAAVLESLENARQVDLRLVEAQQARRILDRLVGYKLSPLLWKKVGKGLSAGRVQSVAVRLVVEREQEIKNFPAEEFWDADVMLEKPGTPPAFRAKIAEWRGETVEKKKVFKLFAEEYRVTIGAFKTQEELAPALALLREGPLVVSSVERKDVRQGPRPPYITSSLQQDAFSRLGFPAQKTMRVAQSLYEGVALGGEVSGLITYMRTDSFNVSKELQAQAREFATSQFGALFVPAEPRVYSVKVKNAQEAHEAIHPTDVRKKPEDVKQYLTAEQAKLYELIWRRFLASQMSDAVFGSVSVDVSAGTPPSCRLRASGRTEKFAGYLKVYRDEREEDEAQPQLPELSVGDALRLSDASSKQRKTPPPPAYNEASLIKTLEKHGIGRPSTYAPIVNTIIDRKYVARAKTGKFSPTGLGEAVTEKLKGFFQELMELNYTAAVEEELDDIAEGKKKWDKVLADFYAPFQKDLASAYKDMEAVKPVKSDEKCPVCSAPMLLRESRFGKYLSCSRFPQCKGKMRLDGEGNKVVPQKTDEVCELCSKPMVIRTGRRGPFLACSGFPQCKNTHSLDAEGKKIAGFSPIKTERKCQKCQSPLLLRKSARGYFLACSGYPKCRNIVKTSKEEIDSILAQAGRTA